MTGPHPAHDVGRPEQDGPRKSARPGTGSSNVFCDRDVQCGADVHEHVTSPQITCSAVELGTTIVENAPIQLPLGPTGIQADKPLRVPRTSEVSFIVYVLVGEISTLKPICLAAR